MFQILIWSTFFISMAGMSWAALAPEVPIPTYFAGQDKVEHLVGFFFMGALLALGAGYRAYWWSLGFCLIVSIGVECAQKLLTTTREFSLDDAAASALGGFIGLSLFSVTLWMASLILQKRLKPGPCVRLG